MLVSRSSDTENEVTEITQPRIVHGIFRDRFDFAVTSSTGVPRGFAQIWKWGAIRSFCLSW
jgi:hypothetical protein